MVRVLRLELSHLVVEVRLLLPRGDTGVDGVNRREHRVLRVGYKIGVFRKDRCHVESPVPRTEPKHPDMPLVRPPDDSPALDPQAATRFGGGHPIRAGDGHVISVNRSLLYTRRPDPCTIHIGMFWYILAYSAITVRPWSRSACHAWYCSTDSKKEFGGAPQRHDAEECALASAPHLDVGDATRGGDDGKGDDRVRCDGALSAEQQVYLIRRRFILREALSGGGPGGGLASPGRASVPEEFTIIILA